MQHWSICISSYAFVLTLQVGAGIKCQGLRRTGLELKQSKNVKKIETMTSIETRCKKKETTKATERVLAQACVRGSLGPGVVAALKRWLSGMEETTGPTQSVQQQ